MRMLKIWILLLVVLFTGSMAYADTTGSSTGGMTPPDEVVRETAKDMFAAMNHDKAELKAHPGKLYDMIGKILLPHFDFDYASRLVLGRYWRSATPAQRKEFEDAFYKFLVHSYADGMLKGNYSERNIVVEPWRGSNSDSRTMVRSKVTRQDGPPVEVDYAMVKTKDGWKAFDVTIEGISYVMNYRNQFGPEIEQNGMEALIKRLEADTAKVDASKGSNS